MSHLNTSTVLCRKEEIFMKLINYLQSLFSFESQENAPILTRTFQYEFLESMSPDLQYTAIYRLYSEPLWDTPLVPATA
jgi:hypothetical protein